MRDAGIGEAARDDRIVGVEVVAAVEREAVHRHALGDPDADGRDLVVAVDPHARAPVDPAAVDAELGEHVDQHALEPAHVADDVDRVRQAQDGIPDELAGPVPGDLAAAVDVDDGSAVGRALGVLGAFAGRVHGRVLQEDDGVRRLPGDDGTMGSCALKLEGFQVRHGVGA